MAHTCACVHACAPVCAGVWPCVRMCAGVCWSVISGLCIHYGFLLFYYMSSTYISCVRFAFTYAMWDYFSLSLWVDDVA